MKKIIFAAIVGIIILGSVAQVRADVIPPGPFDVIRFAMRDLDTRGICVGVFIIIIAAVWWRIDKKTKDKKD
jgi:hypothetical protein